MNARILLTAPSSGCGKTTITIALLKALRVRGLKVASFKCGPDYIDPMYHKKTLGIPAYNLDPFFCDRQGLCEILLNGTKANDISVIEGVMGYYDGYGPLGKASTFEVADNTETPAILIINAKGIGSSVGAIIKGFMSYKENSHIKGVIFNNTSKGMYSFFSDIAKNEGLIPLGFMPYNPDVVLESRHLGLITADEFDNIQKTIDTLGEMALENLDVDGIIKLANSCEAIVCPNKAICNKTNSESKVRLAIAKDEAFCFIYQENLDILSKLGCELLFFSPLKDEKIPDNCQGLYLPGGYPELYSDRLSQNKSMLLSIKDAIKKGLPTIAECGGFMYLHEKIEDKDMVGVIKGSATKKEKLVRFGYGTMTANNDCLILKKGDSIRIHEFHYYDSDNNGDAFEITKASNGTKYMCAYASDSLYAGYPHLYFRACKDAANNFVKAMRDFRG